MNSKTFVQWLDMAKDAFESPPTETQWKLVLRTLEKVCEKEDKAMEQISSLFGLNFNRGK